MTTGLRGALASVVIVVVAVISGCGSKRRAASTCVGTACEAACTSGNATACGLAAETYFNGANGAALDYARSFGFANQGCDAGDAHACSLLGLHYQDALGTSWDPAKAVEVYERSCAAKHGTGCFNLATMYRGGHGVDVDQAKADDYTERARLRWEAQCKGDGVRWCTNLAFLIPRASGDADATASPEVTARAQESLALNQRACEAGVLVGCAEGLRDRLNLKQITQEVFMSELEVLCTKGEPSACSVVGATYLMGNPPIAADPPRGLALVERGCAIGHKHGCLIAGMEYLSGESVTADQARAQALFTQACDRALPQGCTELARAAFSEGRLADAVGFAVRACQMGDGPACGAAATAYDSGEGAPLDQAQATRWYVEACRMGDGRACTVLVSKRIELPVPPDVRKRLLTEACENANQDACAMLPAAVGSGSGSPGSGSGSPGSGSGSGSGSPGSG